MLIHFESGTEEEKVILPVSIPDKYYNSGLLNAVSKVIHAAATDWIKPVFHSVCFTDNKVVATDSRRLAMSDFTLDIAESIIIDRAVIDIAIKDKLDYITITADEDNKRYAVITNQKDVTVITKEVDGIFPNYKQIIPKQNSIVHSVTFNPSELMSFMKHKEGVIIFNKYEAIHKNTGHTFKLPFYSSLEIGFMSDFLKDCFKNKSEVTIHFTEAMSPVQINSNGVKDIIMPVQLKKKEDKAA